MYQEDCRSILYNSKWVSENSYYFWIANKLIHSIDKHPTLKDLSDCLLPTLAPYWKDFCIAVNFDKDGTRLKIIDQTHSGNPEECCREVFMTWLKQEQLTWQKVFDCLRNAHCKQLAEKVIKFANSLEESENKLATG